jgi:enterochelin esterase-like enzyme
MSGRLTAAALPIVVAITIAAPRTSVTADSPFETLAVHGPSLEGNLEGDSPDRRVFVYLPPGYAKEPGRRFPVVYLLHGYGGGPDVWNNLHHLRENLDRAFAHGARELIVVAPDAQTLHNGSFYSNSVTIGDWERFIADDLVRYVDAHYRTIPVRASRGIAGFSMGGYGTLRVAMKRPETFSSAYAMSSCCLTAPGVRQGSAALEKVTTREAAASIDRGQRASLALAAAWAPNPTKPPLYFDAPTKNGEPQPEVLAAMSANAAITMIHQHIPALKSLKAIGMEIGLQDGLLTSNERMHDLLNAYGIKHSWETYEGDHGNRLGERIETRMVPFFSEHLASR